MTYSPVITANWEADSSEVWTVPLGGGAGKIFPYRRTSDECSGSGLLQLGKTGFRCRLGAEVSVAVIVPEIGKRLFWR